MHHSFSEQGYGLSHTWNLHYIMLLLLDAQEGSWAWLQTKREEEKVWRAPLEGPDGLNDWIECLMIMWATHMYTDLFFMESMFKNDNEGIVSSLSVCILIEDITQAETMSPIWFEDPNIYPIHFCSFLNTNETIRICSTYCTLLVTASIKNFTLLWCYQCFIHLMTSSQFFISSLLAISILHFSFQSKCSAGLSICENIRARCYNRLLSVWKPLFIQSVHAIWLLHLYFHSSKM